MQPLISICLPNLNNRSYLDERLECILAQTHTNWELVVSDNYSDDGAWELFQDLAARDGRVLIEQAPRKGMYANWNNCIRRARGDYIYIATSDDTMAPACLERLVATLEARPECGVAHCSLEIIDGASKAVPPAYAWENFPFQEYFGTWMHERHVRKAPHDGILHLAYFTVYTSITQLLTRRRVFVDLGDFRTDCGSYADFEWGMRVGLRENVAHVPEKLATWRLHAQQATQADGLFRARAGGEFHRLARAAIDAVPLKDAALARTLRSNRLSDIYLIDELRTCRDLSPSASARLINTIRFSSAHPLFALRFLFAKSYDEGSIVGPSNPAVVQIFTDMGLPKLLEKID